MKRYLTAATLTLVLLGLAPGHVAAQAKPSRSCMGAGSSSLAYGQTGNRLDVGERAEIAHDINRRLIHELGLPTPGAFNSFFARQHGSVDDCLEGY